MKTENVLRVIVMLLIGLFVCISIDFGMILASNRTSVDIANRLIPTAEQDNKLPKENDVEINYSESVKRHTNDFENLHVSAMESEDFTPALYRWLWEDNSTQ